MNASGVSLVVYCPDVCVASFPGCGPLLVIVAWAIIATCPDTS